MKDLLHRLWVAEPVAFLAALAGIVPLIVNGLVVFDVWHPTADQLAYVLSFVVVLSSALGIKLARSQAWAPETVDRLVDELAGDDGDSAPLE